MQIEQQVIPNIDQIIQQEVEGLPADVGPFLYLRPQLQRSFHKLYLISGIIEVVLLLPWLLITFPLLAAAEVSPVS